MHVTVDETGNEVTALPLYLYLATQPAVAHLHDSSVEDANVRTFQRCGALGGDDRNA
jgi:hypothetical protein